MRSTVRFFAGLRAVTLMSTTATPVFAQQEKPAPVKTNNKNTLIEKYKNQLKLKASSFWSGWPVTSAFDGNALSSWFSARGDSAAHRTNPWVEVTFPEDVTVKRITILGNREAPWLKGYTIVGGKIEVFDQSGKTLYKSTEDGIGPASDYDIRPRAAITRVRTIRFTALGDQGKQNIHEDVAIGEFQVE